MSRSREVSIGVDDETVTRKWDAKIFDADYAKAIPLLKEAEMAVPETLADDTLEKAPADVQEEYVDGM